MPKIETKFETFNPKTGVLTRDNTPQSSDSAINDPRRGFINRDSINMPPTDINITPTSLEPVEPVTLPPPIEGELGDSPEAIVAGAGETNKTLEQTIKDLTPAPTATETKAEGISSRIDELLGETGQRPIEQLTKEQELGIPELRQEFADINNEIRTRSAEFDQLSTSVEGTAMGIGNVLAQQGQIRKVKAAEIGLLQARALGLQGQVEQAQATADRAIDLKFSVLENNLDIYEAQLKAIQPQLTKEQAIVAKAQQVMIDAEKARVADEKEAEKLEQSMVVVGRQKLTPSQLAGVGQEALDLGVDAEDLIIRLPNGDIYKKSNKEIQDISKLGGNDPTVQAYVNQVNSGKLKLVNVPAGIRNAVALALTKGGGTTGGSGGGTGGAVVDTKIDINGDLVAQGFSEGDVLEDKGSFYTVGIDGKKKKITEKEALQAKRKLTPEEVEFDNALEVEKAKLKKGGKWGKSWNIMMKQFKDTGLTDAQLDAMLDKNKYFNN